MDKFVPLTWELEDWFETPLAKLPEDIRARIARDFGPIPWDVISPKQRRVVALQMDYQRDPATEDEREEWFQFFNRQSELRSQLEEWGGTAPHTPTELDLKEARLNEIKLELARMDRKERAARGDYFPAAPSEFRDPGETGGPYTPYPKAMRFLAKKFGATPEELAAWVFWGPDQGGITAYRNANELDPPPRFAFPIFGSDFEYLPHLMGAWFREQDLHKFSPQERYITGAALIERWGRHPAIRAEPFIRAKVRESRLMDMHPMAGLTQASDPDDPVYPHLRDGLFPLSHVAAIEREDFAEDDQPPEKPSSGARPRAARPGRRVAKSEREDVSPEVSLGRQALRKLQTKQLYSRWQVEYRKLKRKHADKPDTWCAQQIAKSDSGKSYTAAYIRKHMKPAK